MCIGLPLEGFSWNLTFEYLSKICRENPSFIRNWREQRVHTWHEDPRSFMIISRGVLNEWDNVEKYGRAIQDKDDNIIRRMRVSCWIPTATNTLIKCDSYCFYTATVVARTPLNITLLCILPVSLQNELIILRIFPQINNLQIFKVYLAVCVCCARGMLKRHFYYKCLHRQHIIPTVSRATGYSQTKGWAGMSQEQHNKVPFLSENAS